jgi:putative GTP pyrophosphokinase
MQIISYKIGGGVYLTYEDFYGAYYETMKQTEKELLDSILLYSSTKREKEGIKSVVYCCSRIKTPESMLNKLATRGFEQTVDAAINDVYDGVGIRVVCAFAEDVYRFVKWLKKQPYIQIIEEKDYCEYPKPNGYRSYHILLKMQGRKISGCHAEIQVRTIANDFWATLEHQIKYKKICPMRNLYAVNLSVVQMK